MLTYELKKQPGQPLYEQLYRCIREDILSGHIAPGQKLPSKRALAAHLEVSQITVEGAYEQLLAEGYIAARQRIGYFAESATRQQPISQPRQEPETTSPWAIDLTVNASTDFPFSVWSRLQRQVLQEQPEKLLRACPNLGLWELRCAIADHLAGFRGLHADPANILVGAGTDFLYNLLIQLLGRDQVYALEEPGYSKIRRIYEAGGVRCLLADMDDQGILPQSLEGATVLHFSPSHHFPTGLVTPISRRRELLNWAQKGNHWIIEDDYDSEFRFTAHPVPTMASMDSGSRVIYMNTFSKTLAPSIRISYMVLPPSLMAQFQEKLGFYSCTVPSFEQYTLAAFLSQGYFEKHINRMRRTYKARRNGVMAALLESSHAESFRILEQDAGLHFLLRVDTDLTEEALTHRCAAIGIRVLPLSHYYHGAVPPESRRCLVINYSGLGQQHIDRLRSLLEQL